MLINDPSVIPVVADPANVDLWAPIAEKADVGVLKKQTQLADASDYLNDERLTNAVIDCLGGMEVISVICQTVFSGACEAAKRVRDSGIPKMTYIYCSGMIVLRTILLSRIQSYNMLSRYLGAR